MSAVTDPATTEPQVIVIDETSPPEDLIGYIQAHPIECLEDAKCLPILIKQLLRPDLERKAEIFRELFNKQTSLLIDEASGNLRTNVDHIFYKIFFPIMQRSCEIAKTAMQVFLDLIDMGRSPEETKVCRTTLCSYCLWVCLTEKPTDPGRTSAAELKNWILEDHTQRPINPNYAGKDPDSGRPYPLLHTALEREWETRLILELIAQGSDVKPIAGAHNSTPLLLVARQTERVDADKAARAIIGPIEDAKPTQAQLELMHATDPTTDMSPFATAITAKNTAVAFALLEMPGLNISIGHFGPFSNPLHLALNRGEMAVAKELANPAFIEMIAKCPIRKCDWEPMFNLALTTQDTQIISALFRLPPLIYQQNLIRQEMQLRALHSHELAQQAAIALEAKQALEARAITAEEKRAEAQEQAKADRTALETLLAPPKKKPKRQRKKKRGHSPTSSEGSPPSEEAVAAPTPEEERITALEKEVADLRSQVSSRDELIAKHRETIGSSAERIRELEREIESQKKALLEQYSSQLNQMRKDLLAQQKIKTEEAATGPMSTISHQRGQLAVLNAKVRKLLITIQQLNTKIQATRTAKATAVRQAIEAEKRTAALRIAQVRTEGKTALAALEERLVAALRTKEEAHAGHRAASKLQIAVLRKLLNKYRPLLHEVDRTIHGRDPGSPPDPELTAVTTFLRAASTDRRAPELPAELATWAASFDS